MQACALLYLVYAVAAVAAEEHQLTCYVMLLLCSSIDSSLDDEYCLTRYLLSRLHRVKFRLVVERRVMNSEALDANVRILSSFILYPSGPYI